MTSELNPFHNRQDEWAYYNPLVGDTMFELGNKRNRERIYKAFFESLGFRHVSVDWNGRDGALNRDLRKPLWPEFGQFDMVCNIGTSEHVSDQRGVWENIHHLTKPGGVLVSVTPYPDGKNWWWHGEHYPTHDFFAEFARLNWWHIERIGELREPPFRNTYVRAVKQQNAPFIMPAPATIARNRIRPR